jgi:hypothetical protein
VVSNSKLVLPVLFQSHDLFGVCKLELILNAENIQMQHAKLTMQAIFTFFAT